MIIILKELAEEFGVKFACLEENTENYLTFSFPERKVIRIVKKGK